MPIAEFDWELLEDDVTKEILSSYVFLKKDRLRPKDIKDKTHTNEMTLHRRLDKLCEKKILKKVDKEGNPTKGGRKAKEVYYKLVQPSSLNLHNVARTWMDTISLREMSRDVFSTSLYNTYYGFNPIELEQNPDLMRKLKTIDNDLTKLGWDLWLLKLEINSRKLQKVTKKLYQTTFSSNQNINNWARVITILFITTMRGFSSLLEGMRKSNRNRMDFKHLMFRVIDEIKLQYEEGSFAHLDMELTKDILEIFNLPVDDVDYYQFTEELLDTLLQNLDLLKKLEEDLERDFYPISLDFTIVQNFGIKQPIDKIDKYIQRLPLRGDPRSQISLLLSMIEEDKAFQEIIEREPEMTLELLRRLAPFIIPALLSLFTKEKRESFHELAKYQIDNFYRRMINR